MYLVIQEKWNHLALLPEPVRMADVPAKTEPGEGFPASPCVHICKLDDNGVCTGCRRSIDEIAGWSEMTAEEQWRVVDDLPGRRG